MWLSLVERYVRDVEAAGSNPVTSTKKEKAEALASVFSFFDCVYRFEPRKCLHLPNRAATANKRFPLHSAARIGSESCQVTFCFNNAVGLKLGLFI